MVLQSRLIGLLSKYPLQFRFVVNTCTKRYYTTKRTKTTSPEDDGISNEPIKYSQSGASKWLAADSRRGHIKNNRPVVEPFVIVASLVVFMTYFCVLREENDLDAELGKSLYNRIEGLEEVQLRNELMYREEHGLETGDIINKLKEIDKNV